MNSKSKIILGIVVLGFVWLGVFVWKRYNAIKRLQVTPDYPFDFKYNGGFVVFTQRLFFNNGDPVDLNISRVNLDVVVNNNRVGKATLPMTQTIFQNQITGITVFVTATVTDIALALGSSVYDLLRKKTLTLKYQGVVGGYGIVTNVNEQVSINPSEILKAIIA